jgi:glycosyltransferase involved in cell wall biosynthesis
MRLVFYDLRFVRTDFHDGISRFSFELGREYSHQNREVVFIATEAKLPKLLEMLYIRPEKAQIFRKGQKIADFAGDIRFIIINDPEEGLAELSSGRRIAQFIPDGAEAVVYSPMQTVSRNKKFKLILSLHDTIYYDYPTPPKNHPWFVRLGWRLLYSSPIWQSLILNRADAVVTVSKTSRKNIQKLKLTKKPVFVIYNAPPAQMKKTKPFPPIRKIDNLLYIGSSVPYKNIPYLIRAMEFLPNKTLYLAILNLPRSIEAQLKALVSPDGGKIEFVGNLSPAEMNNLYGKNTALVSASKAEGFGLPVVEAGVRGRMSLLANIAAFREVGEKSASYFDLDDPKNLSETLNALTPAEIEKKCNLAVENATRFSWKKSAENLQKVILSVMNNEGKELK